MSRKGIGGHHSALSHMRTGSEDWLTPKFIIDALGKFDLDPCTPKKMPWKTARKRYTKADDGLSKPWHGRVWLNPPYGRSTAAWLRKMARHNDGIALVFARAETEMFHESVWPVATGLLFLRGRISFIKPPGIEIAPNRRNENAGGPSVLIAYNPDNAVLLSRCSLPGAFVVPWSARPTVEGRMTELCKKNGGAQ